jgi:hypothetical protein
LFARAVAGVGTGKRIFLPPSAISRMARSAALLLTLRQPSSAKRVKEATAFFHRSFLARLSSRATDQTPTPHARMGETTAAPLRRSLIHACWIVIQNRREPALDLREAPAIAVGVTSLPVYSGWVRRSRRAVRRVQPDRRHYQKPRDSQTYDSYKYPTFGFHFPPPSLNASQRSASAMLVPLRRA